MTGEMGWVNNRFDEPIDLGMCSVAPRMFIAIALRELVRTTGAKSDRRTANDAEVFDLGPR